MRWPSLGVESDLNRFNRVFFGSGPRVTKESVDVICKKKEGVDG